MESVPQAAKIRNQFIFTLVFHDKYYKKACDDTFKDFIILINKIRNNNTSYLLKYGESEDKLNSLESEEDYNDMKKSKDNKVFLVFDKNEGIVFLRKKMKINYRIAIMKKALSNMTHKRFARFEELTKRIAQSREMIQFTPMKPIVALHSVEPFTTTTMTVPKVNMTQSITDNGELTKSKQIEKKEKEKEKKDKEKEKKDKDKELSSVKLFDHKISCNSCKKNILGKRYLCAICNKFNICNECKKEKEYDHEHHFFISIKNSKKFDREMKLKEENTPNNNNLNNSNVSNNKNMNSSQFSMSVSESSVAQYKLCLANNESFEKQEVVQYGTTGDRNIFLEINTNAPNNRICLEKVPNPIDLRPLNKLSWKVVTYIRIDIKNLEDYQPGHYQQQLSILHKDSQGNCTMLSNNNINLNLDIV